MRPKMLWVSDAGVASGFARAAHSILDQVRQTFDVTVLGMNYRGDPHPYPYPIYAAAAGGDAFGVLRMPWMCHTVQPDLIVIQQDGWNIPYYVDILRRRDAHGIFQYPDFAYIPIVAIVAVDGKNFRGEWLNGVSLAIFWTEFALTEARVGGYKGPAAVIPLGVDLTTFYPMDKLEARIQLGLPSELNDKFIVGNVNRNQPRKRWDLTIKYFSEWRYWKDVKDAQLYLHAAPTGDQGCDVKQLSKYYGVLDRVAYMEPELWYGMPDERLRATYNSFDVQISTTQGEGFGLTTFEGMACGIPQIVPDWSALGELCKGAATLISCPTTAINPIAQSLNVIGGVPDGEEFIQALDAAYQKRAAGLDQAAIERVQNQRYDWGLIGLKYAETLLQVIDPTHEDAWQDLGRPVEKASV